jgi:hypothetical protein
MLQEAIDKVMYRRNEWVRPYSNGPFAWVMHAMVVIWIVLVVGGSILFLIVNDAPPVFTVITLPAFGTLGVVGLRILAAGVFTNSAGVLIRNSLNTRFVRWEEVESFFIAERPILTRATRSPAIRLRNGEEILLWPLNEGSLLVRGQNGGPEEVVTALSEALPRRLGE